MGIKMAQNQDKSTHLTISLSNITKNKLDSLQKAYKLSTKSSVVTLAIARLFNNRERKLNNAKQKAKLQKQDNTINNNN